MKAVKIILLILMYAAAAVIGGAFGALFIVAVWGGESLVKTLRVTGLID